MTSEESVEKAEAPSAGDGVQEPEAKTPTKKATRPVDMQLGKCRWVRLLDNITYIACGVVLREAESGSGLEVLLVQEAKKSCRGKWYLPAGRVEPGETIEHAVRRELREESGFSCSADELICVQVKGSGWYRFVYSCSITEGALKTEPDEESLAAAWYSIEQLRKKEVQLRSSDVLRIIDEAVRYRKWRESLAEPSLYKPIQVTNENQPGLFIEFMIIKRSMDMTRTEVLVHRSVKTDEQLLTAADAFPTVEFGFEYFFPMVVSKCYRHLIEDGPNVLEAPSSLLAVSCLPSPVESLAHGLRVRLLCQHKRSQLKSNLIDPNRYHWIPVPDDRVLSELHIRPEQFRTALHML
uniref:Nudix hydrolase domain-containing protein n=1 Tax=Steinernema glaseri TaxID=37863 RepID=A0A1I8AHN9_9BILA